MSSCCWDCPFPPRFCLLCLLMLTCCACSKMSALQKFQKPGPVIDSFGSRSIDSPWSPLFIAWVASILLAFLLGIIFWHVWGPRFHQLTEAVSGLSWTLRSGIRGALVSGWNMLKWGVINFLDTNRAYETEPVLNPHFVEIDRMPPPPFHREEEEEIYGPEEAGTLVSTPVRRPTIVRESDVDSPWEMHSPNGNRSRGIYPRTRRTPMYVDNPFGWNIQDIAFLGRWKSSAVFRYIEQALQDVPANLRAPTPAHATGGQPNAEQMREKVIKVREVADSNLRDRLTSTEAKFQQLDCRLTALEDAKEQGPKMLDYQRGTLWALSKGRSGRLLHVVKQASWNLPLQEWSTSCGWKFAKRNVKVELTRNPDETTRRCEKCEELEKLRDKVNGGVELAQLVEIWLPTKQLDHQGVKQQHQVNVPTGWLPPTFQKWVRFLWRVGVYEEWKWSSCLEDICLQVSPNSDEWKFQVGGRELLGGNVIPLLLWLLCHFGSRARWCSSMWGSLRFPTLPTLVLYWWCGAGAVGRNLTAYQTVGSPRGETTTPGKCSNRLTSTNLSKMSALPLEGGWVWRMKMK